MTLAYLPSHHVLYVVKISISLIRVFSLVTVDFVSAFSATRGFLKKMVDAQDAERSMNMMASHVKEMAILQKAVPHIVLLVLIA